MSETTASTDTPKAPMGHQGQTFLVGEEIYIRAVEPSDAKRGQSWTTTILPRSTARYEKWIKEEMTKQKRRATYVILRKSDDVPVGSIRTGRWDPRTYLSASIDPLYGEQGQHWLAE